MRSLLFVLALALLAAAPARAQETGAISGSIRDVSTSSSLGGVRVEAVAADGRVAGVATSDGSGRYRITGLAPGNYSLVISRDDIPARRVDVEVRAGRTSNVDTRVAVGNVTLDPLVVSASKRPEKALEAPARVEVVPEREIEARPVTTPADHLRSVPGIDVAQTGLQSSNVTARGFNNIFSGALHALSDYRIAGVPSLRVNFLHFVPSNNDDISRMEVVLGPGAALYGPNTADGILHIITKSPLDEEQTTVSVGGGEQNVFQAAFRTSHRLSQNFGIKLSGQYLTGEEWRYVDPAETAERQAYLADPTFYLANLRRATGIDAGAAQARVDRIASRDYDIERWGGELRADWRVTPGLTTVFSAGTTHSANGIELTGLGASQVRDWRYTYYQARANWNRFFGQVYLNQSDAGDTYLLRNGAPIVDKSSLLVGQLQHGTDLWGGRQSFTYGADFLRTNPVTEGTINGWYEDDDETTEIGAYLQSETQITPQLELVLAGRVDDHSALPDPVFSPRAALVWTPREGTAFRVSYNRAFSTPSSLNQFLDLGSSAPDPTLARLGYSLRIQGTGDSGFQFGPPGSYQIRSPFTPQGLGGPGALIPAGTAAGFYPAAVQVLAAGAAARGQPLPATLVNYLLSLNPAASGVGLNYFNVVSGEVAPLSELALPDLEPIRESTSNTLELGYKGILGGRVLLAADLWWSRKENLVTPLTVQTPLVTLNGQQLAQFFIPRFMADLGMSQAQAQALAVQLVGSAQNPGLASVPLGVISSAQVDANGPQLLVTYVNVDEAIELWGSDVSTTVLISDEWSLGGSFSFVNKDRFETEKAGLVTLNAPRWKGSLRVGYDNDDTGLSGEVRMRYNDAFPVSSGVYVGTRCIDDGEDGLFEEECVESNTLFDLTLGYRVPMLRGAQLQLYVSNLFDEAYRPFPGTPTLGRMALVRVKYDF